MKEINVDGFCFGANHKKCYFFKEAKDNAKFCGLWMRTVVGAVNPRKGEFRCTFCNAKKVIIESNGGPALNEREVELQDKTITISNF
jgi:hypothetical protein